MKMFITLVQHGIFCSNFVNLCILTLSSQWYKKCDEGSPSIILAGQALMVKMLITLEPDGIFIQILYTYVFKHFRATDMKKVDDASTDIIMAGQALLVKMVITLELHGIFGSNFVYLCILILSGH